MPTQTEDLDSKLSTFSYSAGERGVNRVTARYRKERGSIYLLQYKPRREVNLGHTDMDLAKAQADEAAARLRRKTVELTGIQVGTLFDIYLREVSAHKSKAKRKHDARAFSLLTKCFGARTRIKDLTPKDWQRFIRERSSGVLTGQGTVRARTVQYDLKAFRAAMTWALDNKDDEGRILLPERPILLNLKKCPLPKERSPRRPPVTDERYKKMLEAAPEVHPMYEALLVVCHETGHRVSAIAGLEWGDIDWMRSEVEWRGELDKEGNQHRSPLTQEALDALLRQRERAGDSKWVFPAPRDSAKPVDRGVLKNWWYECEEKAGLERVPQLGYHGFRRKLVNDLKGKVDLDRLRQLGGWLDLETMIQTYMKDSPMSELHDALAQR